MKQLVRSFLAITLLASTAVIMASSDCSTTCNDDCKNSCDSSKTSCGNCHSVYIPRSTDSDTAYNFLPFAHKADMDTWYAGMELGVGYQRSFKDGDIARTLFGSETLKFQGSQVATADKDSSALLADYFGLSPFADTSLTLKPRIENINLHFQSYLGFDCWLEGLYGQVNFTFTHQKRELRSENNSCDTTVTTTEQFPAGYMSTPSALATGDVKTALGGKYLFGDMQTAWNYGKFNFCSKNENKVAGVDVILGYDFWRNDCSHLGAYFIYVAPTGNKVDAEYVFNPIVGNGKHHEVGGGLQGHWKLWEGSCDDKIVTYLDGYVTTMLKNHQNRSFDFKNAGCMSRYMLLKELTPVSATYENPSEAYTYAGHLINAINWTTRNVDVKVAVKGDATLRFVYTRGGFDFGLGYNFYGQTHEKIGCTTKFPKCGTDFTGKNYGLKGCNGTTYFYYDRTAVADVWAKPATDFLALSNATSSNATINGCGTPDAQAQDSVVATPPVVTNYVAVDWTSAVVSGGTGYQADVIAGQLTDARVADVNVIPRGYYSNPAKIVTDDMLDTKSAQSPKQISSKGFVTMDYTWTDCDWTPYLGLGASVEGGNHETLKQWGVWIKGGISF